MEKHYTTPNQWALYNNFTSQECIQKRMIDCYMSKTEEMEQLHDVSGFRVNHSALKDFIGMIKKILCLIWRTPGLKEIPQHSWIWWLVMKTTHSQSGPGENTPSYWQIFGKCKIV